MKSTTAFLVAAALVLWVSGSSIKYQLLAGVPGKYGNETQTAENEEEKDIAMKMSAMHR